ncbi:hypothetical protein LC605_32495 [Nostoc sp. CHAB 5836]|nr:hypothetical protein [Nostoc sp. CHAB 5836]
MVDVYTGLEVIGVSSKNLAGAIACFKGLIVMPSLGQGTSTIILLE